jgi:23S rRNA pseudouridine1911/1915/1917 synthase
MQRVVKTRIPPGTPPLSLLSYLENRFTYHSRDDWHEMVDQHRMLINGIPAKANMEVEAGDTLEYRPDFDQHPEPDVDTNIEILYEDEYLLAVDKPSNLPCHPAGIYFQNTLWAILKERLDQEPYLVHRLDRETSGIVLVAKSPEIARTLQKTFQDQLARKSYLVLVEGKTPLSFMAEGAIATDTNSAVRKKRCFTPLNTGEKVPENAQYCKTRFRSLEHHNGLSLLLAQPHTGRLHQIRATLHSLGYPVVGDKIYGRDETMFIRFIENRLTGSDRNRLRMDHQALHHFRQLLPHPKTGHRLRIQTTPEARRRVSPQGTAGSKTPHETLPPGAGSPLP